MARRVFHSFHYDRDAWRVQQVENMGVLEGQPLLSSNKWEKPKKGMSHRRQRFSMTFLVALFVAGGALALAPAAFAQGGSPSQAYPLSFDKQFNGDTSRQASDNNGYKWEFSSIALKAGDYLTVDWSQPIGGQNYLDLMSPDTNDNNWNEIDSIASRQPTSTGGDEFKLSILRSGTYFFRMRAYGQYAGAYSITVHVRRGVKPGDMPSSARTVTSGRPYEGDVSNHIPDNNGTYREFWRVLLRGGDHVTVSWAQPTGGEVTLYLLPVGTNNGNYQSVSSLVERGPTSNGRDAFSLAAPRKGWYYLDFSSNTPGAYSFRLTARHRH